MARVPGLVHTKKRIEHCLKNHLIKFIWKNDQKIMESMFEKLFRKKIRSPAAGYWDVEKMKCKRGSMFAGWWLMVEDWGLRVDDWWLRIDGWWLLVEGWGLTVDDWGLMVDARGLMVEGWGLRVHGWHLMCDAWWLMVDR